MGASITLAGESLIAQKLGSQQRLDVVRFIFANVPGLNPSAPVDRTAGKPPAAQVVHTYTIPPENIGFVNPNQVVYSSMIGSDIGDFDWNWIGLETAENVLLAVAYVPLQQKRKNIPPLQLGNNVTRNILVAFDGAQAVTGVTIDAKTWQHDFTVRLKGIDERERLSNRDFFGRSCFFGDAFKVEKVGSGYQLKPGVAYVEGIRIELIQALPISVPKFPTPVSVEVSLRGESNDVVASWTVTFGGIDYTDSAGFRHYTEGVAYLSTTVNTDFRPSEPIGMPLIQYLAARVGDYPMLRARATTKTDVGLSNLPNAISDDDTTNSSVMLATTKAVNGVRKFLLQAIDKLIDGTTPAGKAKQLETARKVSISGVGTGSATFDGTADVNIQVTAPDIVAPGIYPKVTVNAKGLVSSGESLKPVDIPGLDWSKITSGKPTTVEEYGIKNALVVDKESPQKPVLYSPVSGGEWKQSALEIREVQLVTNNQSGYEYAPRIAFHWGAVFAGDLGMSSTGELRWNGQRIWTQQNFNPDTKANKANTLEGYGITDTYTIEQCNQQLAKRVAGDSITVAGFSVGNSDLPYFRHANGEFYFLQRRLGFNPVEQGGGVNQSTNKVRCGWDTQGNGLRVQVDATDLGVQWCERNFFRPDSNNFLSVAVNGAYVSLPAGGTWCYSLKSYSANGQGLGGAGGQAAGGTVIYLAGASSVYGFAWRYAP